MTAITEKITQCLETFNRLETAEEFYQCALQVKNDIIGASDKLNFAEMVDLKRYELEEEDLQIACEALTYLILHLAKMDVQDEITFEAIFESSGLKVDFAQSLLKIAKSAIPEIRELLAKEAERGSIHFKDFDWRLDMVTGCRQRQKMFLPKYTVKLELEQKPIKMSEKPTQQAMVFDMDYTNMKRLQDELQAAIKSVDNTYSKKVQKFIR